MTVFYPVVVGQFGAPEPNMRMSMRRFTRLTNALARKLTIIAMLSRSISFITISAEFIRLCG